MDIAVITPLHEDGNRFIEQAFASLQAQTFWNWQWFILENSGGKVPETIAAHPRVTVSSVEGGPHNIGQLKHKLCQLAQGKAEITVELDCDDELAPNALSSILHEIRNGADFVYSDFAEWKDTDASYEAKWGAYPYGECFGWKNYEVEHRGMKLFAMSAPPVTPHNLRLVLWAPNHVRAWRTRAYWNVGGHDSTLAVCDDHDLIVRMYLAGAKFVHIPECLYFYRVHGNNTVSRRSAEINDATWRIYQKNIWPLAERFAHEKDLRLVDLCGAHGCPAGYTPIDEVETPGGIQCDLNGRWALQDQSVGLLRAADAVEHLRNPIHTMNEAYRVLAPGGFFMISVPSTNGLGAFCDPTHVSFWNKLSFRYYCDQRFAKYVRGFEGRFQLLRVVEWFPDAWHKENNVPYVDAQLVRLGEGYEPMGDILWPTRTGT
jgi:predicted SAM-dependent methyltransferase